MSAEDSAAIRRRRRTAPEPIAAGEKRNVTVLLEASVYNKLATECAETGCSMSAIIERSLQDLAETAEERAAGYLSKWLALPEFRAALHEHARFMRETVRAEMRAEREAMKSSKET